MRRRRPTSRTGSSRSRCNRRRTCSSNDGSAWSRCGRRNTRPGITLCPSTTAASRSPARSPGRRRTAAGPPGFRTRISNPIMSRPGMSPVGLYTGREDGFASARPPRSRRFSRPPVTHGPDDPPGGPEAERRPPVRRPRDRRKRGTPDPQRRRPHAARRPRPHGRLGEAGPATGDGAALRRPRHRQQAPRFDGSRGPSTPRGAIPCDPQDLRRPARWGRSRPSGLEVGGDVLYRQDAAVHRAPAGHRPGDRRRVEGPEAARAIGTDPGEGGDGEAVRRGAVVAEREPASADPPASPGPAVEHGRGPPRDVGHGRRVPDPRYVTEPGAGPHPLRLLQRPRRGRGADRLPPSGPRRGAGRDADRVAGTDLRRAHRTPPIIGRGDHRDPRRRVRCLRTHADRGYVLHDSAGHPIRVIGSAMDVTKRRKTEAIQSAIYRISEAANSAKDLPELYGQIHKVVGGLMPATNFYIALVDDRRETLEFPYFVDEEEGAPRPQKLGRGLTEYVLRTGRAVLASPEVFDRLIRDGEVVLVGPPSLDWAGAPPTSQGNTIGVIVVQSYAAGVRSSGDDRNVLNFVAEQIANAIDRKRTQERLLERERLATMGQLASFIGHELNTPLTSISLLASAARKRVKSSFVLEKLDKIDAERRRAAEIIRALLGLSKTRDITMEPTDLRSIVGAAAESERQKMKPGVTLEVDLGEKEARAMVDPPQTQEVVGALLRAL